MDRRSIREARAHLPHLVDLAERGESTVITRHGKPVAKVAPIEENVMDATHVRLIVKVAAHEASDPTWRVSHAAETISIVLAYFEHQDGTPIQGADGTFAVHAPSRTTLGTLRQMLVDHEGLTIVREDEVPGNGLIVAT